MKLVAKYTTDVENTLSTLNLMISERKDEIDRKIESDKGLKLLYGVWHKRKEYYNQDSKISQLREEIDRITAIAIPESYSWEEDK